MEYETSYDTGLKPFNHDKNRGKWKSSKDFFFACAGHAFKADAVMIMPIMVFEDFGIVTIIPYLIVLAVCVVPIVFIQSFLGQFSSTGFISVFRISPLFKGIGYVALVLNFLTLTYYSIFSVIPMFYFFHSLRPTIPWSCEGSREWMKLEEGRSSFCVRYESDEPMGIPSVEFFMSHLNIARNVSKVQGSSFSFELMLCTCIIWGIVTYVILKSTELIGRIVEYSFIGVVVLMTLCLIRFAFLPGAINGLRHFLYPRKMRLLRGWDIWLLVSSLALSTMGPGWGSILTMASFNKFKTNIFKFSWVLCLAQLGLMIGMAFLSIFIKFYMEFFAIIPYLILLAVCVVPIVFLQSFLGQFSSTGFISVFRISPLFKGIGYVALVLNFLTLTYYSIFSAIPMFYFFHSMRPTIPWSCEASPEWMNISEVQISFCSKNYTQKQISVSIAIPSVEFFMSHLNVASFYNRVHENSFSIELMLCTCIIWGIVTYVILNSTELIGRIIKYSFIAVVAIMALCLVRFVFLPGAIDGLWNFLLPEKYRFFWDTWIFLPSLALSTLGPGWGSILTMASFNNFKTNIFTYSWVLCLAQLGLMIGMALLSIFIKFYMETINPALNPYFHSGSTQWMEFLSYPTAFTFLEMPHLWSLLFFGMWILGSMNILVVQLLSLLTSMFDDFEELREVKKNIIFGVVAMLTFTSIFFCSNNGVYLMRVLSNLGLITQTVLNLLLLLVVLWIYGRERFQRDLNFMTARTYSTWMVNVVRFVAPLFLLIGLLVGFLLFLESDYVPSMWMAALLIGFLIFFFSWCLIPGYCIFKIKQTTGFIGVRLRRCLRPTDWYPADPVDKQRYEESFNRTDIGHQLTEDMG